MDLVLANASSLSGRQSNPTVNLTAALRDFEAVLSHSQKLILKGNYTKPGANDVIAFVSRIDADNKSRAKRCVGPRLVTFLDCTVQFTGIVDTFVQSNPGIAALVWGGVKTTILSVSNYASYFDKVTELIMKVSRTAPTYGSFGELYPGWIGLQTALCDYYAIIIRLGIKIIEVSRRPGITQLFSSVFQPFEVEFKSYIVDLSQATKDIDIQIALAAQQAAKHEVSLAKVERKQSAVHRRLMEQFNVEWKADVDRLRLEKIVKQDAKKRFDAEQNLCQINHVRAWRQAKELHLPGTAEWFEQDSTFKDWNSSIESSILWCTGSLGTGKTVFASNVVAKILERQRDRPEAVSYFFCRADDAKTLTSRNILGSICRQLLGSVIAKLTSHELSALAYQTEDISSMDIVELMSKALPDGKYYYVILDGLDECEKPELEILAKALALLQESTRQIFRIVCVSRPELESTLFSRTKPQSRLVLSGRHVDADIGQYIASTLDRYLKEGHLLLGDPGMILRIAEALQSGANGMFLWARLLMDEICGYSTDEEIIEALNDLPRGLVQVYDRKMDKINSHASSTKLIKILKFCSVCKRALTQDEMLEALSIEIGQKFLVPEKFIKDINVLISSCCGLLHIDEQDTTIHFIHHSVNQYLSDPTGLHSIVHLTDAEDLNVGFICLTYLNFTDFEQQLAKRWHTNLHIDPLAVGSHLSASDQRKTAWLARNLLKLKGADNSKQTELMSQTLLALADMRKNTQETITKSYYFLAYAKEHWMDHLSSLSSAHHVSMWTLFGKLSLQFISEHENDFVPELLGDRFIRTSVFQQDHAPFLETLHNWHGMALQHKHEAQIWLRWLAKASARGKRRIRHYLSSQYMSRRGVDGHMTHENFLKLCSSDAMVARSKAFWEVAMEDAVELHLNESFRTVVEHVASLNCTFSLDMLFAFRYALENKRAELVPVFAQRLGIDVKAKFEDKVSPMDIAVRMDDVQTIVQLCNSGAPFSLDIYSKINSRLLLAVLIDNTFQVRALLEQVQSVDPPPTDLTSLTPLQAAVEKVDCGIIKMLIRSGADSLRVSSACEYKSAFDLALEKFHVDEVMRTVLVEAVRGKTVSANEVVYMLAEAPPQLWRNIRFSNFRGLRTAAHPDFELHVKSMVENRQEESVKTMIKIGLFDYNGKSDLYNQSSERALHVAMVESAKHAGSAGLQSEIIRHVKKYDQLAMIP